MIEDVLQRAIGFAGIGYVIWAEQNAMVSWNRHRLVDARTPTHQFVCSRLCSQ